MKNFKDFTKTNESKSEAITESKKSLIDAQVFIDCLMLSKDDFKNEYNEEFMEDSHLTKTDISNTVELASKSKIEKKFLEDEGIPNGFNMSDIVHKAKYKNVFIFENDITAEFFLISSDEKDLPKMLNFDSMF